MSTKRRPTLEECLARHYSFDIIAGRSGNYVIVFPDLPNCVTQVRTLEEVGQMADEIRTLWIESEYEAGEEIPEPSLPEEYSGKFNVRLPKSLHRTLAHVAEQDGVSLNTYVCMLLARNHALDHIEQRFDTMEERLDAMEKHLRYTVTGIPAAPRQQERFRVVTDD